MTKPESWERYPRSLNAEKDRAALVARIVSLKVRLAMMADILDDKFNAATASFVREARNVCTTLDQEHAAWIAQRGIEAVREAVL